MSIENIQFLLTKLDQEHTSHLQKKSELSKEIKDLTQKEIILKKALTDMQAVISGVGKRSSSSTDVENTSQLVTTVKDLEREINQSQYHSTAVETELTHERVQLEMIKNKIEILKSEKEELDVMNKQKKQEQLKQKSKSRKVQDKRERLVKLRKQIEKQEKVKQNLSNFIFVTNLIEQAIENSLTIDPDEKVDLEEVNPEINEMIIEAKDAFQEAQDNYSANDLTPFLQEANRAFQLGVKSFILLSDGIIDELADKPFSDQVFVIVNKGLTLNTRHLNAVESMLQKIEKGVEIAPLASFANEIKEFFTENLSLLKIYLPDTE
jgi:DNA repair exonuclease SbcCD ATPase subunit